jgi:hypothetical protein
MGFMGLKIFAAVVAVALMITYLAPVVLRLREVALTVIVLIGLVMMLVDLWQSLQSKED